MVEDGRLQAQHNYSRVPLDTNIAGTNDIGFAAPEEAIEPLMRMCYGITARTPYQVEALRAPDVIAALEDGQHLNPEGRRLILGSSDQLNEVQRLIALSSGDSNVFINNDVPVPARDGASYAVALPEELHDAADRLISTLDVTSRYITFRASEMVPEDPGEYKWTGTGENPLVIIGTDADVSAALEFVERSGFRIESLSLKTDDALDELTVPS